MAAQAENQAATHTIARHNAIIYALAASLAGSTAVIMIANGGLIGEVLAPDPSMATLPIGAFQVGQAMAVMPAALLMRRIGRKWGFIAGGAIGLVGALTAIYSGHVPSFIVFLLAALLIGVTLGTCQHFRFAATDIAADDFKPKAISWVMMGGILSGILGPQIALLTADLFHPVPYIGVYAGSFVLLSLMIVLLVFGLKVPPQPISQIKATGRKIGELLAQPKLQIAILCGAVAYGLMAFTMTAAPLAMKAQGLSYHYTVLGIQFHVLGMYLPSLITGYLIARYGVLLISSLGFVQLILSAVVALMGVSLGHFWVSLILLGTGWNFSFIGATTMVTQCHEPEERGQAQGFNDLMVFSTVVVAAFSAGAMLEWIGWETMNAIFFPLCGLCLILLFALGRKERAES